MSDGRLERASGASDAGAMGDVGWLADGKGCLFQDCRSGYLRDGKSTFTRRAPHINARLIAMAPDLAKALIKAGEALNLHTTFEETPTDRGGYNGPKGRAWKAWIEAKTVALTETKKLGGNK